MHNWAIFPWEFLGTAVLMLIGIGANVNSRLPRLPGRTLGWTGVTLCWAAGVFAGASIAGPTGGSLNPAISLARLMRGEITGTDFAVYVLAQLLGAIAGSVLAYLALKKHFDQFPDLCERPDVIGGSAEAEESVTFFATAPVVRAPVWNAATETTATFVLVLFSLLPAVSNSALGYGATFLVIYGIGSGVGGSTGYAMNPARDLGPRIAHALLPIPGKRSSDWGYAWVPIVGPFLGAVLATGVASILPVVV